MICQSTYNIGPSPPFDFSILYATIPHAKLKEKLWELIQLCFIKMYCLCRYTYLVLGRDRFYFVQKQSDSTKKFSQTDMINMLAFLIDNIFAIFGGRVVLQTIGIPIGRNCAPLLADLFLYSYEADFTQGLLKKDEKSQSDPLISRSAIQMMSFH